LGDTEKTKSDNSNMQQDAAVAAKRPAQVWSWLLGALGGAVIVGAVWATVAHVQSKPVVIAKVGNSTIDQDAFYSKLEANSGSQMLEQMITSQLIKDGAAKYHITATPDDIQKATQQFESQYGVSSQDQLNAMLAQYNMTMSDFQDIMKTQVLEQKLAVKDVKVTDKDIQDFYNAHKANYTKQGAKTPQPLSAVRSQVIDDYKQSQAVPSAQLLANLAKEDPITILDPKYSNVKTMLENPVSTQ
jgi:SurA N-terminal domain/PPIC-type PPIASE domain